MRWGALVVMLLVACGARTEEPEPAPDCSAAHCLVIDDERGVGCVVRPSACDGMYDQLCPPSVSFAEICAHHMRD